MKASMGRIITVVASEASGNGSDRGPAIITRVWGDDTDTRNGPVTVNATCFKDCGAHLQPIGSVRLYDTREDAERENANGYAYAYWPERV